MKTEQQQNQMNNEGWIKIHRKIMDHWVWKDPQYFHAWITILITVNYEPKKVYIQGELLECDRGQAVLSLQSWVKLFGKGWTIQRVRHFFDLLEKEAMIIREGLKYTTRLSVCNYDTYQDKQQTDNKLTTNSEQIDNKLTTTTKEYKESKEVKNNNNDDDAQNWRGDFESYLKNLKEGVEAIKQDQEFIKKQEKFYPSLDIKLTIEKAVENFWSTEAGWKNKKQGRAKGIDWRSTLVNAIGMKANHVYKTLIPNYKKYQFTKELPGQILRPKSEEEAEAIIKKFELAANGN